jgi:hypothetical protein
MNVGEQFAHRVLAGLTLIKPLGIHHQAEHLDRAAGAIQFGELHAGAAMAAFTAAMAPGSYLICSAGTSTGTSPALIARLQGAYQGTTVVTGRPRPGP